MDEKQNLLSAKQSSTEADVLRESRDWWISEWKIKNREAEQLWCAIFVMCFACGFFYLLGALLG